jgi:hypothetical protein
MMTATINSAERKREYDRRYMRVRREDPAYLAQKREYMLEYMRRRREDPTYVAQKREYMRKYDAVRGSRRASKLDTALSANEDASGED